MIKGNIGLILCSLFGNLSTIVVFVYNICNINKKKEFLSRYYMMLSGVQMPRFIKCAVCNKTLWTLVEILFVSSIQYLFVGNVNFAFGRLVGTGANYFGLLFVIPFFIIVFCLVFRIDPFRQMDLITPAFPFALVFVKLACFCMGCCRGVPMKNGLFNYVMELYEFPSQLLESGVAALLFVSLMYYKKKTKVGTLFPLYLILYSSIRFFTEFSRVEENVLLFLKTYHILCLFGVAFGFLQLFFVTRLGPRIRSNLGYVSQQNE